MIADYSGEVLFGVGQRVRVTIPDVPAEELHCNLGTITGIRTAFARSPDHRYVTYQVIFDEDVIKPDRVRYQQIRELHVHAEQLTREVDP